MQKSFGRACQIIAVATVASISLHTLQKALAMSPTTVDVAGVKVGMSPDEAKEAIINLINRLL